MTDTRERPLSYWTAVARMGFENDFNRLFDALGISRKELADRVGSSPAYVSKVLNGTAGNFQLSTMAKWARAIGAILQIRLIKDGAEVVRIVDYETAARLDEALESPPEAQGKPQLALFVDESGFLPDSGDVLPWRPYRRAAQATAAATETVTTTTASTAR